MQLPLMPWATAAWLVDKTGLTFKQIADFCGLNMLDVEALANDRIKIQAIDPIASGQLTHEEISRCQNDESASLILKYAHDVKAKDKKHKYVSKAKKQDKLNAIAWLITRYPNLTDDKICKLLGTTVRTVRTIKDKTHTYYHDLQPNDPVVLGLCSKQDLQNISDE